MTPSFFCLTAARSQSHVVQRKEGTTFFRSDYATVFGLEKKTV